jgi:hypothetical protein
VGTSKRDSIGWHGVERSAWVGTQVFLFGFKVFGRGGLAPVSESGTN